MDLISVEKALRRRRHDDYRRLLNDLKRSGRLTISIHLYRELQTAALDKEKFKYYMIQDYLYLIDYTKVFAIGEPRQRTYAS